MRRWLPLLFCVPSLGTVAQTTYPSGVQNCIARYDFSSTANSGTRLVDVSNNTNAGTIYNTNLTTGWRGQANTAMLFDGQSSYVDVAHTPLLAPQALTIIGLIRFDGFYNGICQANAIASKGFPHRVSGTYGLYATDQLYDNDCNAFTPAYETVGANLGNINISPSNLPTPIVPGQWYFTAVTYDGVNSSIYQQLMDSTAGMPTGISPVHQLNNIGGSIGYNNMNLTIGRHMDPPYPYWFNGAMDEVAIFNRGLSQEEIYSIYKYLWGNQSTTSVTIAAASETNVRARIENGSLFLEATDGQPLGKVMVYNTAGQLLSSGNFREVTQKVDVSAYPHGLYFIKIARNGAVTTLKASNL